MSTPKKTAPKKEKPTSAMVACRMAGFAYEALSPEVQKRLDSLDAELQKLTEFFAPRVFRNVLNSLFMLANAEIEIVEESDKEDEPKK